ncbi:hypothetical protein KR018_007673 [Drosophila ironensis]|nr:hypothetical protein KR018_007673 [Drosophila ironensis]
MSTIEFEAIGSRLQSLEAALQAQNESHDQIVLSGTSARHAPHPHQHPLQHPHPHPHPHPQMAASAGGTVPPIVHHRPAPPVPQMAPPGSASASTSAFASTSASASMLSGNFAPPTTRSTRPTPNLPGLNPEGGSFRPRIMRLPLPTQSHPSETETDKKLKIIMAQTGKLNINGRQFPTDINDLRHLGDLGNGTSGNVVKMHHQSSDTIIAVKQMRRTGNAEENKRILMDLDVVLKSHDCKYIVKCLGCFVRDPDVWICMELMSMCFDKVLKLSKKPVPERILGKVTVATVNALSYLKDKHGVIHRDVKPSNILIDERGKIKLCDFGISGRLVDSKANTRSAGCAAYMAPERIDPKKPKYDIRADVWSLGITLVELATARSPYEGCNTDFEVLTKVLDSEPPCLPSGEGFNFSQEFQEFVIKCLTKNHQERPKYPELLAQPFIRIFETAEVDVANWFQSVRNGDPAHKRATTAGSGSVSGSIGPPGYGRTTQSLTLSPTNPPKTIKPTQIPSYQQQSSQYFMQSATQLPQKSTAIITTPTGSGPGLGTGSVNCFSGNGTNNNRSGGSGSGSSSASPLSPPGIPGELGKLYRKSPFMQRKMSNGSSHHHPGHYKYNDESPKKESMFSSIGQSILRNLTTSPFSQKKHHSTTATLTTTTTLPHNNKQPYNTPAAATPTTAATPTSAIAPATATSTGTATTPTWRLPSDNPLIFDSCDSSHTNVNANVNVNLGLNSPPSPSVQRQQLPSDQQQQQQPLRLQPGNQSPIVLQRFYHQQNQLREKEAAERYQQQRQQQQQQQQQQQHPPVTSTNPFHSNYVAPPPSTHSTSSQSSTQSNCSQIAVSPSAGMTAGSPAAAGHFGAGSEPLQYQPLPIVGATEGSASTSPSSLLPRSPEQQQPQSDYGQLPGSMVTSKLSKLYARRQLLGQGSVNGSGTSNSSLDGCTREQQDAGWFNTLAGVMKRQFATYVKPQLNSTATSPVAATAASSSMDSEAVTSPPQPPAYRSILNNGHSASVGHGAKSYYYRTLSAASSSSNTSQSTSPTTEPLPGTGGGSNSATGTGTFLRRGLAFGGTGGSMSTPPSPHILAGLDRRHRSPDPPPRYNRGQSPLLLRKNLLELGGQPPGSPLLHRRYVSASPPLPPPRRGSESVPGSPQHFRTRIHYTPEPQRRIYRTIDQ